MSDFKENVEKLNVRGIVLSSVMTAFGLVVALVWKDTIIATVDYLLPNTDDGTLQGMYICLLYTSPSPRDATLSRMPSSA